MRNLLLIGVLLVVLGIAGLIIENVTFTETKQVLDLGPLQVTSEEQHNVPIPTIAPSGTGCGGRAPLGKASTPGLARRASSVSVVMGIDTFRSTNARGWPDRSSAGVKKPTVPPARKEATTSRERSDWEIVLLRSPFPRSSSPMRGPVICVELELPLPVCA